MKKILKQCKLDNEGLLPAIVQDYKTGEVLMLAYMNKLALSKTLKTKQVHFWSRSRRKLWLKGETSGNVQLLKELYFDCDSDAVLVKVKQLGGAACHTGYRSCFFKKVTGSKLAKKGKVVFDPNKVYNK